MTFRTEVVATMAKLCGFQNCLNASKTEKSVSWLSPWLPYPFDISIFYLILSIRAVKIILNGNSKFVILENPKISQYLA